MYEYDVQIRWKNFRSFKDTGWLTIKPITVLIGANNAGKTSILAPLLLLNQTLTSRDASRALITRGHLVDVGSYKDLIHNHNMDLPLSLAVGFHLHEKKPKKLKEVGEYPPGALQVTFDHSQEVDIALKRYTVFDLYRRPFLNRNRYAPDRFTLGGSFKVRDMIPAERRMLRNAKPTNFFFSPSSVLYQRDDSGHTNTDSSSERNFSERLLSMS